jgi:hypothetical protein
MAVRTWHVACERLAVDFEPPHMPATTEPTAYRVSNGSDASRLRNTDEGRFWRPRCEPALTHFELGASSEYRPHAALAKRYTPRYGVRKE